MDIGIIGAGTVGSALAASFTRAGNQVIITSTDIEDATAEEVNDAFRVAATGPGMDGVLGVSEDRLASVDIIGDTRSAVIDAANTHVSYGRVAKVLAWYEKNGDMRPAWSISPGSCPRMPNPSDKVKADNL